MKQQIVLIPGGNAFRKYEDYLKDLENTKLSLSFFDKKDWKTGLGATLGDSYQVIIPQMPNRFNARYKEWKIWFDKIADLLEDDVVLIGSSLGGIFLAKYLAENTFTKKLKAVFLIAAPYNTDPDGDLCDFVTSEDLSNIGKQTKHIFVYQSKNDEIVPFEDCHKYMKLLPEATLRVFESYGHFKLVEFPEIIEDIQALE
jgi:predicted alpha/beta hydrolase family esterase